MQVKSWRRLFLIVSSLLFSFIVTAPISAQEDLPETIDYQPTNLEEEIGDNVSLDLLGFGARVLNVSQLEANYTFILPAHWELSEGATFTLDFLTTINDDFGVVDDNGRFLLEVNFNGMQLDIIPLTQNGPQTLTLTVPSEALTPLFANTNGHFLNIKLITNAACGENQGVSVAVQPNSEFVFPHQFVSPDLNLERLPYPIQQRSFLGDEAVVVIPDSPSSEEMKAFMTTSAGLGRITGQTDYEVMRVSDLTDEVRADKHFIMVGNAESFSGMIDLAFIDSQKTTASSNAGGQNKLSTTTATLVGEAEIDETDGILQISQSPWNPTKAVLYVGGNNDEGTLKAARAVGYGTIRTGNDPTLAIINEVYFEISQPSRYKPRQTFSDLGYELATLNGPSVASQSYSFFISPGMEVDTEEPSNLLFIYNHSALLQYDLSGINIRLNNQPVHSMSVHKDSTSITQELIELPAVLIQPGMNTIRVDVELEPFDNCSDIRNGSTWLNIFPESTLYIPLKAKSATDVSIPMVNQYPQPMVLDPMLGTTTIILPNEDAVAWTSAFEIAFDLGRRINDDLINIEVAFADDVSDSVREGNNLIIVGFPSELPFLDELAEYLPVPIEGETNRFEHDRLPIEYEIPPEVSMGYINIMNSPWHENYVILLVMGDSEEGLEQATRTLLNNSRRLDGDFVVVEGDQRFTTMTPLPEAEDVEVEMNENAEGASEAPEPAEAAEEVEEASEASDAENASTESGGETVAEASVSSGSGNEADGETAVSPQPTSNNNNQNNATNTNTVQRQGLTLPIAVLTLGLIALVGFGIRVYLVRRKQT